MSDIAMLDSVAETRSALCAAIGQRIVGQHDTIDAVLTAVFAGGHALLVGVPGLAKTLLVHSIADALGWQYRRIQFTPDLMPSDITGTEILREDKNTGERSLAFVQGPLFGNLILADEINRTPPKTQSALLEAMQERAVTVGGQTRQLPQPFFVLATQNPIEQEGTYPLPEAQLDRFLLSISLDYPSAEDELAIALLDTDTRASIDAVLDVESFAEQRALIGRIPVPEVAAKHAVELVRRSRPQNAEQNKDSWVQEHVGWGAGPRASQALIAAARAHAALQGIAAVGVAEIRHVAPLVLAHRVVPSFAAAGQGIDGKAIVHALLERVQA